MTNDDIEVTDTNGNKLMPGKYTLVVSEVPDKGKWGENASYYGFTFLILAGGKRIKHEEKIPVWLSGSLLRALGCKEIAPGKFEWAKSSVLGTMFDAEIVYETNVSKKDGKKYENLRIKMPVAIEGFPKDPLITGDVKSDVPF